MTANLWMSLTMKIMALGHTLRDAQHLAAVILIERRVIYTIMGYRLPADEPERIPEEFTGMRESLTVNLAEIRGIFPARPGTAAGSSRALLVTQ